MKSKKRSLRRLSLITAAPTTVVVATLQLGAPGAHAATYWWNTNTTSNWGTAASWWTTATGSVAGTAPSTTSDTVTFNGTGKDGASIVTLTNDTSVGAITFANTGSTTFQGNGFSRNLTVGTGGITINSNAGAVTFSSGASPVPILVSGNQTWTNNSTTSTFSPNAVNVQTSTLTLDGPGNTVMGSGLNGSSSAGALIKNGTGTLTLIGNNAILGPITVNQGTIKISVNTNRTLGQGGGANTVTINPGGAVDLNGITGAQSYVTTINGTGVSGGGALTNGNSTAAGYSGLVSLGSAASIIASGGNISLTNSGIMAGATFGLTVGGAFNTSISSIIGITSGNVTKQDAGTLTLLGANTYTGGTVINGGTVVVSGTAGNGTSSSLGAYPASAMANFLTFNGGTLTAPASGAYRFGALTSGNEGILVNSGGGTLASLGGSFTLYGPITGAGRLTISGAVTNTNSNASQTGGMTVNNGATYSGFGANNVGPTPGSYKSDWLILDNGTITFSNSASFSANQGLTLGAGGGTVANFSLPLAVSSVVTGSGNLTQANGANTLTLNAANNFTGDTKFSAGKIVLGNALALQNSAFDTTNTSASIGLDLSTNAITAPTFGGLKGSVNLATAITSGFSGMTSLTLNPQTGATPSYSGIIANNAGNIALIKSGPGTQTLTNANTYAGTTTIKAGTLALGSGGSFANSPTIVVGDAGSSGAILDLTAKASGFTLSSAQTLKGIGTVNYGTGKALTNNGILAPGNSVGTLNVTGDYTFGGTSTYQVELGAGANNADKIAITGAATITGGAQISFTSLTAPDQGKYILATAASGLGSPAFTLSGSLPTGYQLLYSASELDLQHQATISLALGSNPATVHVGLQTVNLMVGNTAPTGSADLNYSLGNLTGAGGTRTPGSTSAATGTYTASAGVNSFNVSAIDSNASNSPQSVAFSQTGYNLASANTIATPVNLTNVHVGDSFGSSALTIQNTAAAGVFTEGLNATQGAVTGHASVGGTNISNLGGGNSSSSILVGLGGSANTGTAGTKTGTVTIGLASSGTNSSLADTTLTGQTVTVNGGVYNLGASNLLSSLNLGTIHKNESFTPSAVAISNTATAGSFSEGLNASFGATTGNVSHNSGTIVNLIAGGSNSTSLTAALNGSTAAIGTFTGTVGVNFASNGTGTSSLGNTTLAPQTVTLTGQVNEYAQPLFTGGAQLSGGATTYTLNLGSFNTNTGLQTASISLTNFALDAVYQDDLGGSFTLAGGNFTLSGFPGSVNLASGSTLGGLLASFDTTGKAHGIYNGSFTFFPTSVNGSSTSSLPSISMDVQLTVIPEPGSLASLLGGVGVLVALQRRRSRNA